MKQAIQIIRHIENNGGQLYLADGQLIGERIDQKTVFLVRKHKAAIIHLLASHGNDSDAAMGPLPPCAHSWLKEHDHQLKAAGWTPGQLYRRNKSIGIAWMRIWCKPDLTVTLAADGRIIFRYKNKTGKQITQTAWPRRKNH